MLGGILGLWSRRGICEGPRPEVVWKGDEEFVYVGGWRLASGSLWREGGVTILSLGFRDGWAVLRICIIRCSCPTLSSAMRSEVLLLLPSNQAESLSGPGSLSVVMFLVYQHPPSSNFLT